MRQINAAYVFVGISLLAGASWAAWSSSQNPNNHPKEQKSKSKAISVAVAEVEQRDVDVVVSAVGTVAAKNTVVVKNRIAGELKALYFEEGDWVKAGQLLAQIDDRQWQAQLKQVQGQVARNLALLKNAQLDLQRYRDLAQQQLVSQQQIEAQKALVEQYQGTVLSDQGVLEQAKLQLSYCQIKAANSGRIGLRQVDVGNQLAADSTLAVIHQLQPAQVLFSLPDNQLASTPNRSTLKVEAWDKNQQQNLAIGQIVAVDNQVEANTGSIKIKAEFANQQQQLLPNQFVNLRVKLNTLKQAHVIPVEAIQQGQKGEFVYVLTKEQTVTLRPITTDIQQQDWVVVTQGLSPKEQVVISGLDKLRDGANVVLAKKSTTRPNKTPS